MNKKDHIAIYKKNFYGKAELICVANINKLPHLKKLLTGKNCFYSEGTHSAPPSPINMKKLDYK